MESQSTWLVNGNLLTPQGVRRAAIEVRRDRIAAIRPRAPTGLKRTDLRSWHVAPGFIDLHIWGDPERVAREELKTGTTAFLSAIGPEPPELLVSHVVQRNDAAQRLVGARCLGIHLEGPFLNPLRAGALASRWLRPPTSGELRQLVRYTGDRLKLVTLAPEIPRGLETVRWLSRRGIVVSVGHSDANASVTQRAIKAGARAVTHVYNGMRPLHHREPGLLGEILTDDRLTAMVILDGVHVDPVAFQLLLRCKGPAGIILVTDSIRHQTHRHTAARGAFYTRRGVLAGSRLTMMRAVRNAVEFGTISVLDAVHMASRNPARLLGLDGERGTIDVGKRADLVVFDRRFQVVMTFVDGKLVYQRR